MLRYLVLNADYCCLFQKGTVFAVVVFARVISEVNGPILVKFAEQAIG